MAVQNQFLSVRRAAQEAGVAPQTIKKWIARGEIQAVQQGTRWYIRRYDLEGIAGPSEKTLMHHLLQRIATLEHEKEDLLQRIARLERMVLRDATRQDLPVAGQTSLSIPMPNSQRDVARFLARHGVKLGTAMTWFNHDPPLSMDPAEALVYAVKHYQIVGYRGRGCTVHLCNDPHCVCVPILGSDESESDVTNEYP
jgi:excisionase family DNA binding protein